MSTKNPNPTTPEEVFILRKMVKDEGLGKLLKQGIFTQLIPNENRWEVYFHLQPMTNEEKLETVTSFFQILQKAQQWALLEVVEWPQEIPTNQLRKNTLIKVIIKSIAPLFTETTPTQEPESKPVVDSTDHHIYLLLEAKKTATPAEAKKIRAQLRKLGYSIRKEGSHES